MASHRARPCDIQWIRSIKDQCKEAGVSCFVKQLGKIPIQVCGRCGRSAGKVLGGYVDSCGPEHDALIEQMKRLRDSKGGDWDEWPADLRVREMPTKGARG